MMKRMLVVGGAGGIGLSIATEMAASSACEKVYIIDKSPLPEEYGNPKFEYFRFDLESEDYSIFDGFDDIDSLMITAGFGHLSLFKDVTEQYISSSFAVNGIAPVRIIHRFMPRLLGKEDFHCGVMVSIAGFMSSPFFAVYGATKAALKIFIESVNVELLKSGSGNRILNVSPGSIAGTGFRQGRTDLNALSGLSTEIIRHLSQKDDLFIPDYEKVYKEVLERYSRDFRKEGIHSYEYKLKGLKGENG